MPSPPNIGDRIDVEIDRLGYGGDGVAHPDGFTLFIPRSTPGDKLSATVTEVRRQYGRALPVEILQASPARVTPTCSHYATCGGCHYQHINPDLVVDQKVLQIRDSFERYGPGLVEIRPIVRPDRTWNYRNRVTYRRAPSGELGFVRWDTFGVVDIDSCPVAHDDLNSLWGKLRKILKEEPVDRVQFVVLRRSTTGELAAIFSTTRGLGKKLLGQLSLIKEMTSISVTKIAPNAVSPSGKEVHCASGSPTITEDVEGIRYILRPDLFFQIHPEITTRLVRDVVTAAGSTPVRTLDLYCGAGLFTLALAKRKFETLGVDIEFEAIQAGAQSSYENGLQEYARFRAGKTDRILHFLHLDQERFTLAVADPPRRGLHPGDIEILPKLGIKRLLYVSCSPPTLARDAKRLVEKGYNVDWIQPYDMFPQTYHVEMLTSFTRNIEA